MSDTTKEGPPGRRSSSGPPPGLGHAGGRGRGRGRGRGLLVRAQQQKQQSVPGRQPTATSSPDGGSPESTSLIQAQYQDIDSNGHCDATERRGLQPGISQKDGQIDSSMAVGGRSALPSSTKMQADPAVKLEGKMYNNYGVL